METGTGTQVTGGTRDWGAMRERHHGHHAHRADGRERGSGLATGRRSRAMLETAQEAGLTLPKGMMGKIASTLARGGTVEVSSISVMINVYAAGVSVSYGGTAPDAAGGAEDASVTVAPEAADTTVPAQADAAAEEDAAAEPDEAEEPAATAAQGYSVSAWAISASVQYTSASIALSLLR